MNQEEYLSERVDDQINWYDKKSKWNQKVFKILRIMEIIFAAFIPLLSGYVSQFEYLIYPIAIIGLVIVIIAGILSLYRFQENWINYRTICELLKHEKYLFLTKIQPFDNDDAFALFVKSIESNISKEHSQWLSMVEKEKKDSKQID